MALKRRLKILDCDTEGHAMEDSALKVAFASTDMKQVNQHFGSAEAFVIYAVNPDHRKMLEVVQFGELSKDGNEDKLVTKLAALEGCIAVYAQAIGASAVKQLVALGIQPVKVSVGADIAELLNGIQQELCNGPASWLARAIESQKPNSPKRFDEMETDGWSE